MPPTSTSSAMPPPAPTTRSAAPTTSAHEVTRATVRAQRVVLDKAKAELSTDEAAYSQLVDRADLALLACLAKTLVRPKELPFYEVLVFDAKTAACREALGGSPRAAIERALSRPHDYLACECCD